MLTHISKKLTSFFIKIDAIEKEKKETYEYCFEILIASILNIFGILIIAISSATYLEALLFCVGFLMLRSVAGGYHAKTHIGCFLILSLSYISCMLMSKFINYEILLYLSIVFSIVSITIIFLLAPIEHENNPFTDEKKRILGLRSIIYVLLLSGCAIALQVFAPKLKIGFSLSYGIFIVSGSVIFAFFKNKNIKCDSE